MNNAETFRCPACEVGQLREVTRDYFADIGEGQRITVPNIRMEVCDHCSVEILPLASAREIDAAIAKFTDQLTPKELTALREGFGVDKTKMSEALGLGGKTYLRWEQGRQYPSRSMGYYLRVLREFPVAFQWLKERGWKEKNQIETQVKSLPAEISLRFPMLAENPSRLNLVMTRRINYANVFFAPK